MAAPETHPLEHIVTIRRLLEHYEEGFAFIKELIQNADDARKDDKPVRLRLQWYKPEPDSAFENPLLRGPALLVINDGPFSKKDRDGLMRMGMGSKAGDNERIGRFGLGMKAVFHVCEAFFFLESGNDPTLRELFCPWLPPQYQEWQITGDHRDWDRMGDVVKKIAPEFQQWFAVWIPLRRRDLVTNNNPIVEGTDAFPGDSSTCPESLRKAIEHKTPSLGEALIFLKRLRNVTFHNGIDALEFIHDPEEAQVSPAVRYYQSNIQPSSELAEEWKGKASWPKVFEITETGERSVPDKAKWEASVAVTASKTVAGATGAIRLFWNVFLPVGNRPNLEDRLPSLGYDLHLFLHGYFFLSEDRTSVYGAADGFRDAREDDPKRIKIAWNKELATSRNGLLPLIPSALESCFKGEGFTDDQIEAVVTCLRKSEWFKTYRKPVCQTQSFARSLNAGAWRWQILDSAQSTLVFPRLDFALADVERVVASLLQNAGLNRTILVAGSAVLTAHDLTANWNVQDLEWFCHAIQKDALAAHPDTRKYLTRLLSSRDQLAAKNPNLWDGLPIYEVAPICAMLKVVSASDLRGYAEQEHLFTGGDTELKECFKDACPKAQAWFMVGSVPPGISARHFDTKAAAKLVLEQTEQGGTQTRIALIAQLLADASDESVKQAIRFLIHGNPGHRRAGGTIYLRLAGNDSTAKWNNVIHTVLDHQKRSWQLVDSSFAPGINDDQKCTLDLRMCGAESFRKLCGGVNADVATLQLAPFHDFLLTHLNEGTHSDPDADNKLLRRLLIHQYGENQFTTLDDDVWLAPEATESLPDELAEAWRELCQNAKIVKRSTAPNVGTRQQELFKPNILTHNGIIRLACKQTGPSRFAKLILHYLGPIGNPEKETSTALRTASWMPLTRGGTSTLGNLLWLEGAEKPLEDIARHRSAESLVITRAAIDVDFGEHTGAWNTLKSQLIPKGDEAIALLTSAFGGNASLHFGLSKLTTPDALGTWLKAVDGCETDIFPVVSLVRAVWPATQGQEGEAKPAWAVKVAGVFAKEWSNNLTIRYDTALEALRNRHREANADVQSAITHVFHDYLASAVRAGRWSECYRTEADFTLLNQEGAWTPISQLVVPINGIARRALADEHAVRALGFMRAVEADDPLPGAIIDEADNDAELATLLRKYGAAVSETLPAKLWGIHVALLGETPAVKALADELTDGRTETIRDELCGPVGPGINPRGRVNSCRYSCTVTDGATAEIAALNGDLCDAPLDLDQSSFLVAQSDADEGQWWVNRFFVNPDRDGRRFRFRLCDPASFAEATSAQMFDRLERTVGQLLSEVLHVTGRVRTLMEKLLGLGQLSLGRAQQEIVLTAQIHLSQLGIRPSPGSKLADAMRRLGEATSLEAQAREEREHDIGDPDRHEKDAKAARDAGLRSLRDVLQTDSDVHHMLSERMKTRIGSAQYQPTSIPFELFQNADDALAQMSTGSDAPRIFVVEVHDEAVRFAHWGRPINHPADAEGELKRSYERDLMKMLILHGSDKQVDPDDATVTGKFGLGFKSV